MELDLHYTSEEVQSLIDDEYANVIAQSLINPSLLSTVIEEIRNEVRTQRKYGTELFNCFDEQRYESDEEYKAFVDKVLETHSQLIDKILEPLRGLGVVFYGG